MIKIAARVVYNRLPQIRASMRPKISRIVQETTFLIEAGVKESMQGPKTGRRYARSGGKDHQASAPGESPAIDYGVLVNSIQSEFDGGLRGIVFTNTEYAVPLEFGSVHIAARPFMQPAALEQKAAFISKIRASLMEL